MAITVTATTLTFTVATVTAALATSLALVQIDEGFGTAFKQAALITLSAGAFGSGTLFVMGDVALSTATDVVWGGSLIGVVCALFVLLVTVGGFVVADRPKSVET